MHITLETDYAVRIVSVLCFDMGRIDAKTISERATVSLRFALKILRKLVAANIVKSYKGTQGGYQINLPPQEINLKMVTEAIEGTYNFARCLAPDGICNRGASGACCFQKAFGEISLVVRDKLENFNFADMMQLVNNEKEKNHAVSTTENEEDEQQIEV